LKTCACSIKATNYCSATASEKGVVQKCVITYVKSCTAQCVKRSSAITQRNEQFAAEICKQSSSSSCHNTVVKHSGKGVEKVHKLIVKVHVLKKVGVTKKQVTKAIQNKKVEVVDKCDEEKELLQKELIQEEQQNKKLELELLQEQEKKVTVSSTKNENKLQLENEMLQKKLIQEEEENKELELKILKEEQEKNEYETKLKQEELAKHKLIQDELREHSKKCACESASTEEEKEKCLLACGSRQGILKKKLGEYVDETSSTCKVKAGLACNHLKSKAECRQCKKDFIVLCVQEETKRKNELVNILENCDTYLEDEPVYQP